MKLANSIFLLTLIVFLTSCEEKSAQLSFSNENGSVKLEIEGHKSSQLDPFMVNIIVKAEEKPERNMKTEIHASELNEENVSCTWTGNSALLEFTQSDNTIRIFKLEVTKDKLHLRELNPPPLF